MNAHSSTALCSSSAVAKRAPCSTHSPWAAEMSHCMVPFFGCSTNILPVMRKATSSVPFHIHGLAENHPQTPTPLPTSSLSAQPICPSTIHLPNANPSSHLQSISSHSAHLQTLPNVAALSQSLMPILTMFSCHVCDSEVVDSSPTHNPRSPEGGGTVFSRARGK